MAGFGSLEYVMQQYTPRQMHSILFVVGKIRESERKDLLALHALAAQGDANTIKKLLKDDGGSTDI